MSAPMNTWGARPTADGSWTLWNAELDEGCHSRSGAWQQATERYAGACGLSARAEEERWSGCRLLDVGTGLGLNLAAALCALRDVPLHVLTLEQDPAVIEAGSALYERAELREGPWEPWHALVRAALRAARQQPGTSVPLGPRGSLELRLGDARETLGVPDHERGEPDPARLFDAVFLDPFSPGRAAELWSEAFLARVAAHMNARARLSTYSAAFRVRLALARAGLRVGRGPRVGAKGEGTLASKEGELPALAPRLERRLARRKAHPMAP